MELYNNDDGKYLEFVPTQVESKVIRLLQYSLSFRERWAVMKIKAEAEGNIRMAVADFLIEEGLMKRLF